MPLGSLEFISLKSCDYSQAKVDGNYNEFIFDIGDRKYDRIEEVA